MVQPIDSKNSHAIVIGSSVAGALAAHVLSEHYERVTIIERDHLPQEAVHRAGVPQGNQSHALLVRGRMIIESMLPGISDELKAAGALEIDHGTEVMALFKTGWAPRIKSGVMALCLSRPLLETAIRRRVLANPRISIRENCEVTGLLTRDDNKVVTGVYLRPRDGSQPTSLPADLVVDASGRSTRVPEWLEALGYGRPEEEAINAFPGYATRWYEIPENFQSDWTSMLLQPQAPNFKRGGILIPIEGNRWTVTLWGMSEEYPPTDEDAYLEYARSLKTPALYQAIKDAKPISPIYGYRRLENRMNHYERMKAWPEGLMAMGDSYAAFNPTYAQGMTVAAMSAETLAKVLQKANGQTSGIGQRFQKELGKTVAGPWQFTISEDLRWPATQGAKMNGMVRFMHWYVDQVLAMVPEDPEVYATFINLMHVLKGPEALFQPRMIAKVIRYVLRGKQTVEVPPMPQPVRSHS